MTNMNIDMLTQNAAAWAKTVIIGENLALCKVMGSVMMYVDPRDQSIAPHLMINGLWEPNVTIAIAKHVKRGMHCLDVGANVGYFSILMASSGAIVDAFEPNRTLANMIEDSAELNGYQNLINVHRVAVCERNGHQQFNVSVRRNGHSSIVQRAKGDIPIPCDTVKLDSYSGSGPAGVINLSKVDFIKCDVEGAEVLVWAGMQRLWADNPQMQGCFESFGGPAHRAQLYDVLFSGGKNWVGVINPVGNIVPIDRETAVNSTGLDMLWVKHRNEV